MIFYLTSFKNIFLFFYCTIFYIAFLHFFSRCYNYSVNYLANWDNILIAQLDVLVNSKSTQKLLSKIPGIDAQQFRDMLISTDSRTGELTLGFMVSTIRNILLDSSKAASEDVTTSAKGVLVNTKNIDQALNKASTAIDLELSELKRLIDLVFHSLISACRAGVVLTVVALLAIFLMMALFTMNVYTLGYFQHETIMKLFDPKQGYVPSLKKIMPNNNTLKERKKRAPTWSKDHEASKIKSKTRSVDDFEDVNITNPKDEAEAEAEADPFRLVDLFAMMGREPTRKETALLNGLNNARQRRDRDIDGDGIFTKEEKLIGEEGKSKI